MNTASSKTNTQKLLETIQTVQNKDRNRELYFKESKELLTQATNTIYQPEPNQLLEELNVHRILVDNLLNTHTNTILNNLTTNVENVEKINTAIEALKSEVISQNNITQEMLENLHKRIETNENNWRENIQTTSEILINQYQEHINTINEGLHYTTSQLVIGGLGITIVMGCLIFLIKKTNTLQELINQFTRQTETNYIQPTPINPININQERLNAGIVGLSGGIVISITSALLFKYFKR